MGSVFQRITFTIFFLTGVQQCLNAQLPELNSKTITDYHHAIEPTLEESAFLKISWFSELGEAVRLAHKTEKPLLVYVMNGHPLACTWINGVKARQLVWSNDKVQELAKMFVAVADELHSLRTGKTAEAEFFQNIFDQKQNHPGHQGVFLATPSGRLLASSTCYEPEKVIELLDGGLIAWNKLTTEQRLEPNSDLIGMGAGERSEDNYPDDGLVLRVTARDLPATTLDGDRNSRWHRYYIWFNAEEVDSMLPQEFEKGQQKVVPEKLSTRIAALALLDKGKVDGFTRAFRDSDVENAELTFTVCDAKDQTVCFEIRGSTETRTADAKAFVANMPKFEDIPEYRGVKTKLLGFATLDRASGHFTEFRMIAAGTRFGGAYVGREPGDWGEQPIGFSFKLGGLEPAERVAPEFPERYPWLNSTTK